MLRSAPHSQRAKTSDRSPLVPRSSIQSGSIQSVGPAWAKPRQSMSAMCPQRQALTKRTGTTGHLPAVSFLKAPAFQDGHAGYSDPLDEQNFVVKVINALQNQPTWDSTAVVIMYDDSDGWYDHALGQLVNHSTTTADALSGPGACGEPLGHPGERPAHQCYLAQSGRCRRWICRRGDTTGAATGADAVMIPYPPRGPEPGR